MRLPSFSKWLLATAVVAIILTLSFAGRGSAMACLGVGLFLAFVGISLLFVYLERAAQAESRLWAEVASLRRSGMNLEQVGLAINWTAWPARLKRKFFARLTTGTPVDAILDLVRRTPPTGDPANPDCVALRELVLTGVRRALVSAMGVDEKEVVPQANLLKDLGGDDIDLVDVVLRLEWEFIISLPPGTFCPPPEFFTSKEHVHRGALTPLGLARLREQLPWADLSQCERDLRPESLAMAYTVEGVCRYMEHQLRDNG
jgi:acyl carrier protein